MNLYTVQEVAEQIRASPSLVYRLIERGRLRCIRLGGRRARIRVAQQDLAEFLDSNRVTRESAKAAPPRRRLKHLKL